VTISLVRTILLHGNCSYIEWRKCIYREVLKLSVLVLCRVSNFLPSFTNFPLGTSSHCTFFTFGISIIVALQLFWIAIMTASSYCSVSCLISISPYRRSVYPCKNRYFMYRKKLSSPFKNLHLLFVYKHHETAISTSHCQIFLQRGRKYVNNALVSRIRSRLENSVLPHVAKKCPRLYGF
jgi:hypothetical protein